MYVRIKISMPSRSWMTEAICHLMSHTHTHTHTQAKTFCPKL